jgi:hypothetical protein
LVAELGELLEHFACCPLENHTLDAPAIHDERNAPAARSLLSLKYSLAI